MSLCYKIIAVDDLIANAQMRSPSLSLSMISFRGSARLSHRARHLPRRAEGGPTRQEDRYEQGRPDVGESYRFRGPGEEESVEGVVEAVDKPAEPLPDGTAGIRDAASGFRERRPVPASEIRLRRSTAGLRAHAPSASWYAYSAAAAAYGPAALQT